ncbi:TRAP transporter large permease subunit [candidate division WOR-3 bacterium]|nr:TRAP transporter large permease subunit [candidate division WOR-3 bacterium]
MVSKDLLGLAIFILSFIFISFYHNKKTIILWAGVLLLFIFRLITFKSAVNAINWNVIGIFWGTAIVAEIFIISNVPALIANKLVSKTKTVGLAILAVSAFSGFISSFCENVATVMIVAPIAFEISKKLKVSPIPFLIAIAISSNLQGAATLIGDPPSMILAGFLNMNFNSFFFINGKPTLFFAIELGAIASLFILFLAFRKFTQKTGKVEKQEVKTWIPTIFLVLMTLGLISISVFGLDFNKFGGIVSVFFGFLAITWYEIFHKGRDKRFGLLLRFDWETLFFLFAIFILVGMLSERGIIDKIAYLISAITKSNKFLTFLVLVWVSVFLSAFIDNVPYVTAMLPVGIILSKNLGFEPFLLCFGIVIGASIGGNITPFGAAANVVAVGMLKKRNHKVTFFDFVKLGLPFTIVSTLVATFFIWFFWK